MKSLLDTVSEILLVDKKELLLFASSAPHRYKKYYIQKRNGKGSRLIAQPSRQTKFIQRIVVEELRKNIDIHPVAMAYEKGRSIKLNASMHLDSRYFLKMDFRDFFPSIFPFIFFENLKYSIGDICEEDRIFLENLLFWRPTRSSALQLSIGAPSSPFVSNLVMKKFDELVCGYSINRGIVYSRYADDLTFTTRKKEVLFQVPEFVRDVLRDEYLGAISINDEKTVFSSRAFNRHVTGLVLSNDGTISLGREKKRKISAMIHRYSLGLMDELASMQLRGLLSHCMNVEPEFVKRMQCKYSNELIGKLIKLK